MLGWRWEMETRNWRARVLELLGLAYRAGAVERGVAATRRALRDGRAQLVLIADDASTSQVKKVMGLMEHRSVPGRRAGGREALGAALGALPLSAVAITRRDFAEPMLHQLSGELDGQGEASGG